jgi:hypothetical protein
LIGCSVSNALPRTHRQPSPASPNRTRPVPRRITQQIIKGLLDIYTPVLDTGANILAISPLPAPGFVSQ